MEKRISRRIARSSCVVSRPLNFWSKVTVETQSNSGRDKMERKSGTSNQAQSSNRNQIR